jgi:hypothetical protein
LIPLATIVGEWRGIGKAAGAAREWGGKLQIPARPTFHCRTGAKTAIALRLDENIVESVLSGSKHLRNCAVRLQAARFSKYANFPYATSPSNTGGWLAPSIRPDMTRCANSLSKSARRRACARLVTPSLHRLAYEKANAESSYNCDTSARETVRQSDGGGACAEGRPVTRRLD